MAWSPFKKYTGRMTEQDVRYDPELTRERMITGKSVEEQTKEINDAAQTQIKNQNKSAEQWNQKNKEKTQTFKEKQGISLLEDDIFVDGDNTRKVKVETEENGKVKVDFVDNVKYDDIQYLQNKKKAGYKLTRAEEIKYDFYKRRKKREAENDAYYIANDLNTIANIYKSDKLTPSFMDAQKQIERDFLSQKLENINKYYEGFGVEMPSEMAQIVYSATELLDAMDKKDGSAKALAEKWNYAAEALEGVDTYEKLQAKRNFLKAHIADGSGKDAMEKQLEMLDEYGFGNIDPSTLTAEDWEAEEKHLEDKWKNAQRLSSLYNSYDFINRHYADAKERGLSDEEAKAELEQLQESAYNGLTGEDYEAQLKYFRQQKNLQSRRQSNQDKWGVYGIYGNKTPEQVKYNKQEYKYGKTNQINVAINEGKTDQYTSYESPEGRHSSYSREDQEVATYATAEERENFNYLWNTYGEDKAMEYYEDLRPLLEERWTNAEVKETEEYAKAHPWKASAKWFGTLIPRRIENAVLNTGTTLTEALGGEVNPYDPMYIDVYKSEVVPSTVKGNIENPGGRLIYSLSTEAAKLIADMAISKGVGSIAGGLAKANSATVAAKATRISNQILQSSDIMLNTVLDYKKQGESSGNALAMGLMNGLIEAWVENGDLNKLIKMPDAFKGRIAKIGRVAVGGLGEGLEEVESNALNSLAAFITENRDNDSFLSAIDEGKDYYGMTDGEAFTYAVKKVAPEYLESFAAGAILGGTFEGANLLGYTKDATAVREDAHEYFTENGLSLTSVESYLVKNTDFDNAKVLELSEAIYKKGTGNKISTGLSNEINENAMLRGMVQGVADSVIDRGLAKTSSETADKFKVSEVPTSTDRKIGGEVPKITKTSVVDVPKTSSIPISDAPKATAVPKTTDAPTVSEKLSVTPTIAGTKKINTSATTTYSDVSVGRAGGYIKSTLVPQLTEDFVKEGKWQKEADTVFDFMYNQGKEGYDKDVAIEAASELYGSDHKSMYEAFYAAGQMDFDNAIRGRKNAGIVVNDVLKNMRKTNVHFSRTAERAINAIARKIGFDIEFVKELDGADATFDTKTGRFLVSAKAENPFITAVVHDSIHAGRSVDSKAYDKLANVVMDILGRDSKILGDAFENRLALYKTEATDENGRINKDLVSEEMISEVTARLLTLDERFMKNLANEDRGFVQKVIDAIKEFFDKVIGRYKGENPGKMSPEIREAVKMLESERYKVLKAYNSMLKATEKKQGYRIKGAESGSVMHSNISITREDVKTIQSIGRKSINDLTEEELKILEPIAEKYYGEMGVKSPFFRRWFGDWREEDKSPVKFLDIKSSQLNMSTRYINNKDIGRKIKIERQVFNDSLSYAKRHKDENAVKSLLANIDSVISESVLLNTEVSENNKGSKKGNTLLMHHFYVPVEYNKAPFIAELIVEEYLSNENDLTARAYNVQRIKMSDLPRGHMSALNANHTEKLRLKSDEITISDLFQLVKTYDKDFKPVPSSAVVNEDGTPKIVYHGTDEKFTVFDITKSRSWDRNPDYDLPGFYFSENIDESISYGDIRSFYIKINKPYKGDIYSLAKEKGSYRDAYEYLVKEGYDGVIVDDMGEGFTEYIVLKSNNVKSVENGGTFSSWDNDIMKSKPETDAEPKKPTSANPTVVTNRFEIDAEGQAKLDELVKKYGAIKKGVAPTRDVALPKRTEDDRYVRQTTRTAIESDRISDEVARELVESIANGDEWTTYRRESNNKNWKAAEAQLENDGYEKMVKEWDALVESGHIIDAKDMIKAHVLIEEASKRGDQKTAVKLIIDTATVRTTAAQVVQSAITLKKLGTAANVFKIERTVQHLQRDLLEKYGNKAPKLKLPKSLMEDYAEVFDEEVKDGGADHSESDKILDEIYADIAKQLPVSWVDKFNAWRFLAMLGNPRTHIRNFVGNFVFMPAIALKNISAVGGEALASKIAKLSGKEFTRTKTLGGVFAKGDVYKYAQADADKIESILRGEGKYNEMSAIKQKQQVFTKLKFINSWVDTNSKWLEKEDWIALKIHYSRALTMYMKAQKLNPDTITSEQLEKARLYAIREAQKATFRDENSIANILAANAKKNKSLGIAIEAMFPFKKTPLNIVRRGVDYSPIGIAKALGKALTGIKSGKYTVNEVIDDFGAAFSGSFIMILGVAFASQGWLKGPEDDEEKEKFAALNGLQNYALVLGDSTYTIDWLSPAAMPLFAGAELWRAIDNGEFDFADITDVLLRITAPVFDMTMLEGLMSTLETISYYKNILAGAALAVAELPLNLAGQAVPTALGQVARTIDATRRKTYIDKNSPLPQWLQSFYQQQAKKIPGLTFTLAPYVNAKGETEVNAEGNILARALQNFLSPGYYKSIKSTVVDEEINRLYDALGSTAEGIIPKSVYKNITIKNDNGESETVNLSAEQWQTYQTTTGKMYYQKLEDIIKSDFYKKLSDEKKVELITSVRTYADDIGKQAAVPEYQMYKEEAKAYLDNGLFEYVIEPEEKEGTFSPNDLTPAKRKEYVSQRDSLFNEIIGHYNFKVEDYELNDKFYDDVYDYAHKVSLEKNSDGKYTYDTTWYKNAKTLDKKELAQYFYGKGIIQSFDGQEEAQKKANEAIVANSNISGKVKTFLLQKSFGSNYDSGVMYDKYIKKYGVDPAIYGELWQYKNMSDSDEVEKKDVLRKIQQTGLSNEQKSAIYRSFGWKETANALRGVPWKYIPEK